jgi:hypothetical protein
MSSIIFLGYLTPHHCQPAAFSSGWQGTNHPHTQKQFLQAAFLSIHLLALGTLPWIFSSAQSICVGTLLPLMAFRRKSVLLKMLDPAGCLSIQVLESSPMKVK